LDSIHDKAVLASQAAEAAGRQGDEAFWAMHDLLYGTQATWSPYSPEDFNSWVIEAAEGLGLDTVQFEADYNSQEIIDLAEAAWTDGQALGITYTPFLKVNSFFEPQGATVENLTLYVEILKLAERQFTACPPMIVDPDASYRAIVETEKGTFVIELFPESAPMAVNSFIFLAENGWFDGITFHRVLEDFVAQTGDPTGTGYGNPGYRFSVETSPDMVFDREGLVAMANAGPETNGSQFFITFDEAPDLNGGYTIFGEVVEGMDVVRSITLRDPDSEEELPPGDLLISITIEQQ
jgi:cyclophilin family peptidyl-prolyl cis-trans isomerase